MDFRILGPVEIDIQTTPFPIAGRNRPVLLALLLLDNNRVVPTERVIAALWDEDPPATARQQTQNLASALRRDLAAAGAPDLVTVVPGGYRINAPTDTLDLDQCNAYADEACAHAVAGRHEAALAGYEQALALWRGPALAGLRGQVIEATALRLDERRLSLVEERTEARLQLGAFNAVISDTRALLDDQPYRQRTVLQLMRALDHSGWTAEALETYTEFRDRLAEELGIDPGHDLKDAHRAILQAEPPAIAASSPAPSTPVPAELPADITRFTGRTGELARLGAERLATVAGPAGVGKTALVVHWAHRNRSRFPDGQLYVNLRGYDDAEPMTPLQVLRRFLRTFGVTGELPSELDEAAAVYRSLLADRRVLVVLDNAREPEQVRPLLPGGAGNLALVTSRDNLSGLVAMDDARLVRLAHLDPDDSHRLLRSVLGTERVAAERHAIRDLAVLCGHLPLALRIASANLLASPNWTVAEYLSRMADDPLAELAVEGEPGTAIEATLRLSYEALGDDEQRLFRGLGLVVGVDFTQAIADALMDAPSTVHLMRLVNQNLVEQHSADGYRLHDLVRDYARKCCERDEPAVVRDEAVTRLLQSLIDLGRDTNRAERDHIKATVHRYPDHALCWRLVEAVQIDILAAEDVPALRELIRIANVSATAHDDRRGQATTTLFLANLHGVLDESEQGIEVMEEALALVSGGDIPELECVILTSLGAIHFNRGQHSLAAELYEAGAVLAGEHGKPQSVVEIFANLSSIRLAIGDADGALKALDEAGRVAATLDDPYYEYRVVHRGTMHCTILGRYDEAERYADRALEIARGKGDKRGEMWVRLFRAEGFIETDRLDRAADDLAGASEIAIGHDIGLGLLRARALRCRILNSRGEYADGLTEATLVVDEMNRSGAEKDAAETKLIVAESHLGLGSPDRALKVAEQALAQSRGLEHTHLTTSAIRLIGTIHHEAGNVADARDAWTHALHRYREAGAAQADVIQSHLDALSAHA